MRCAIVLALASAETASASGSLDEAKVLYGVGQYFKAARYAFSAKEENPALRAEANSWIALSLIRAGLFQSASYFFIQTLQSGDASAIRRVLAETEPLLVNVGGDLLRTYLIRHTRYEDYDSRNRSAYLYSLGKEALLSKQEQRAIGYLNGITVSSPLSPFALQLRATAFAVLGNSSQALKDFTACVNGAAGIGTSARLTREGADLQARCRAGQARVLYQMDQFDEADRAFDQIQKSSFVWPDTLFEAAWNSFAKKEYNRTLGKLVSYKSPALSFTFNPEIDVLRAQTYLALCLYSDANDVINDFNRKYTQVGVQVKQFVEGRSGDLGAFYDAGKYALRAPLYTTNEFYKMLNRFVRGPYFQGLVAAERDIERDLAAISQFDRSQGGVTHRRDAGFPGFLGQVLKWRLKSIRFLGGAFVKNSMMDHHSELILNFEKMAFIKLEMLKMAKDQITYKNRAASNREWGNVEPSRRDDQYHWGFNGEFWNDELGDYVFGLESECGKQRKG